MDRYISSAARDEFLNSLLEIESVLKKIAPPKRNDPDLVNYIHGAAILFLSAKLENYISDLFQGIAQEICRNNIPDKDVPNSLLGWIFLRDGNEIAAKRYISNGDEGEYVLTVGGYLNDKIFATTDTYVTEEKFRNLSDKSYPSVKNLRRMYKRIGINSIFGRLNNRMKRDAAAELESLNSSRGALAHSGISNTHAYSDVKRLITSIKKLVSALDKETFYHLRNENCQSAWKHS